MNTKERYELIKKAQKVRLNLARWLYRRDLANDVTVYTFEENKTYWINEATKIIKLLERGMK